MYLKFSLFALFVLSAYAGSEEHSAEWKAMKEEWKAAKEKCVKETGADLEIFKKSKGNPEMEVDRTIKCFGACLMKDHGSMNPDGTFNLEKAIEIAEHMPHKDKIIEALTACADEKGDDDCETAHAIFSCLHEKKAFGEHDSSSSEEE